MERALTLGEIDFIPEVQPATFNRLSEEEGIETVNAPTYSFTELAFNLCSEENCPDAKFNPAVQDKTLRQAIAYSIDRERNNEIANQGTSFVAHGLLPSFYKDFYEVPEQDYPYDPELANQLLDEAGWELNEDGIREKDGMVASFDLFVRSEAPAEIQYAKLVAEQTQEIGVEFNVQVVSTDKLTELTVRKVDGIAGAGVRHLHLGLGRRSVRPERAPRPPDHESDRGILRRLLLEPGVRPALRGAAHARR